MGKLDLYRHMSLSVVFGYGTYVYVHGVKFPPDIELEQKENFGPFKYLTFWNLVSASVDYMHDKQTGPVDQDTILQLVSATIHCMCYRK